MNYLLTWTIFYTEIFLWIQWKNSTKIRYATRFLLILALLGPFGVYVPENIKIKLKSGKNIYFLTSHPDLLQFHTTKTSRVLSYIQVPSGNFIPLLRCIGMRMLPSSILQISQASWNSEMIFFPWIFSRSTQLCTLWHSTV